MSNLPFVTVLMPVRNEAAFIEASLGAVLAQDYPQGLMEVLVIDGMSDDGMREIVSSVEKRHSNLRLLDNPCKIVPTGLNIGLQHARGEIIIRVDGHCKIAPDYVSRCVHHLMQGKCEGVGGPIETVGMNTCARAIAAAMSVPFGVGGVAFRTVRDRASYVDTVAFPAYKRWVMDDVGYFDEELVRNQDDEYNYRLRKLGGKLLLAPDIRSRYYSRGSLSSLWRQYLQYGYWKVRVLQKHPAQMQLRQFVPFSFVCALFISALLALFSRTGLGMLVFVAGSYLVANLISSITTAKRKGLRLLPLLPVTFATIHLAYGIGFLWGLVKFRERWGDHVGLTKPTTMAIKGANEV